MITGFCDQNTTNFSGKKPNDISEREEKKFNGKKKEKKNPILGTVKNLEKRGQIWYNISRMDIQAIKEGIQNPCLQKQGFFVKFKDSKMIACLQLPHFCYPFLYKGRYDAG